MTAGVSGRSAEHYWFGSIRGAQTRRSLWLRLAGALQQTAGFRGIAIESRSPLNGRFWSFASSAGEAVPVVLVSASIRYKLRDCSKPRSMKHCRSRHIAAAQSCLSTASVKNSTNTQNSPPGASRSGTGRVTSGMPPGGAACRASPGQALQAPSAREDQGPSQQFPAQ